MTDKNPERDASVDRLLGGTLKARADAETGAACLDAGTLAAWADGALDARERASAEAHAADCGRCQALLAAMVKTAPPPSAAPFRTRLLWWLAPMVPVAAALVIWFAVPTRTALQQSQSAESIADQAAPPPAANARAKSQPEFQAEARQSPPAREQDAARSDRKTSSAASTSAPAEPAAGAVAPVAGAAPAAVPATPAAADSSLRREAMSAPARLNAFASSLDSVIVSSNPATRFRLLPGGGVQRSADGGATWRTEVTGATETLIAGTSPSPSVCWLIGRSGTVLLSTDGRSWRRLAFLEAADLQSVAATDSENATVTAVDGRALVTTDGGQTWSRVPNP